MPSPSPSPVDAESPSVSPPLRDIWNGRAVRWLLGFIAGGAVADTLFLGRLEPRALALRAGWILGILWLNRRHGTPAGERRATYGGILLSSVCCLGLAALVGGLGSPYFTLVFLLPLGVGASLTIHGERGQVWACGGVCLVGTGLIALDEGRPRAETVTWLVAVLGITVLADFLWRGLLRVFQSEQAVRLERARRESLEALAQSEHRRAQSEKLATVGRLASGVAHEINNPLAYVDANVDFVREELLSSRELDREQLADVLGETRMGLQHIRQIVADLKGFAHMDAQEPAACALGDVVADALKLGSVRLRHVALLRVDVPADLPEIVIVRQRLVQVVLNLLVNAGDALEAHRDGSAELFVTGRVEAGRVVLLVEDNGPGFPPEVLPRLFEAFFTTKGVDKGTGLGLTLSRELVRQFGGALTADNRPQGGARLRIELTALPRSAAAGSGSGPRTEAPSGHADGA